MRTKRARRWHSVLFHRSDKVASKMELCDVVVIQKEGLLIIL